MKKPVLAAFYLSLLVACQNQEIHSPKPTENQQQLQAFEHTGKLVDL
jgi:hypothetical protein